MPFSVTAPAVCVLAACYFCVKKCTVGEHFRFVIIAEVGMVGTAMS